MKQDDEIPDWNTGYWTEGMDRINNCAQIVEMMLDKHPSIIRSGLEKETSKIISDLYKLYQKMGSSIPDDEW